jgi:XRE family transcriptional regulator, regulator of sulfur utilization
MRSKMPPRRKSDYIAEAVAFGERIRALRLARKLTQERLAEAADMNVVQLSNIERGANEPKLTTIIRLARALDVRPGKLIEG